MAFTLRRRLLLASAIHMILLGTGHMAASIERPIHAGRAAAAAGLWACLRHATGHKQTRDLYRHCQRTAAATGKQPYQRWYGCSLVAAAVS
eukprot:354458-Chlamydomonas_euryale.AAC.6